MKIKSAFIPSVLSAALLSVAFAGGASSAIADDDISHAEAQKLVEAGTIKSFEELDAAALALHPGATIEDTELELERGRYVYQVELRGSTPAEEWDIEIDAATGEVLSDRRD
jgi:uncharacterized membrane protein YkoI